VVIRYFGGTKLGAGGLTRAYGNTAKKVIEACTMAEYIDYTEIKLELDYKQMQHFEYQLEKLGGTIMQQGFAEKISLLIKIPVENLSVLVEHQNQLVKTRKKER
jgi:putative IMPACT (imprinted ancient) family translation regulator